MCNPNLRVKHKKYKIKFKEEVVRYAKEYSVNETAKKFGIHRKSVQEWKKKENCLMEVQRKYATTFLLVGAERKVKHDTVERGITDFFRDCRAQKLPVSRRRLKLKGREIYQKMVSEGTAESDSFTASEGWLSKCVERHDLTMRRSTTVCQKTPDAYVPKLINFLCFV